MFDAIAAGCLVLAALIGLGFRWAPALALLPSIGLPAMLVSFLLTHRDSPLFLIGLLLLGCGAIAVGGRVAATVQNYLRPASSRPLPA